MSDMKVLVSTNILPVDIRDIPSIMKGDKGDKGTDGRDGSYVQKAYKSYASMVADKDNIPTNTNVVVNNDPDKDKNAFYTYDGAEFTKSDFDPQGILTTVDVRLNQAVESASEYFQSQVADTISTSIDNSTVAYTDAIEVTKGLLVADAKLETKEALNTVIENGGLPAKPFATKALMTASALVDGDYAMVTDDAVNNGLYVKTAGAWVKSSYDPLGQAKAYTDTANKEVDSKINSLLKTEDLVVNIATHCYLVGSPLAYIKDATDADSAVNARTAIISVKPSTEYTIKHNEVTDSFKVAVFDSTMGVNAAFHVSKGRLVYDFTSSNIAPKGEYKVVTNPDEHVLVITYALNTVTTKNVEVYESGKTGIIKRGKNLANTDYKVIGVGFTKSTEDIYNISKVDGSEGKGVVYWLPVEPSTTYTISKQDSSRFMITEMAERNDLLSGVKTYRVKNTLLYDDLTSNIATVTTSAGAFFLGVYVSNSSENPFLQVEKGAVKTDWVTVGYALDLESKLQDNSKTITLYPKSGDMTDELQAAIDASTGVGLVMMEGVYNFKRTLKIPSGANILGFGEVVLQLSNDYTLSTVLWRGMAVQTLLSSGLSSADIKIENIKISGKDVNSATSLQWGLCLQGKNHNIRNVSVNDINFIGGDAGELRTGGDGWGLVFYNAKNCRAEGGSFTGSGYENVGIDTSENIDFYRIYCGMGWRTSLQVHRGSSNIILDNCTIEQTASSATQTHAAITLHGRVDQPVKNVKFINCTINAQIGSGVTKPCGAIHSVESNEHDVTIDACNITSNHYGIATESHTIKAVNNWIVTKNRVNASKTAVYIRANNSLITTNILAGSAGVDLLGYEAGNINNNNIFTLITP